MIFWLYQNHNNNSTEMNKYKNLQIWKRSVKFATDVYQVTKNFPDEEKFGLIFQIRKCAISIPSNIAEGAGRGSNKDFKRFVNIAYGSSCELETQLLIAVNLKFITTDVYKTLENEIIEIQKMMFSFSKQLEN